MPATLTARRMKSSASGRNEGKPIPVDFDFDSVSGLSAEAREKLKTGRPDTIGQAASDTRRNAGGRFLAAGASEKTSGRKKIA